MISKETNQVLRAHVLNMPIAINIFWLLCMNITNIKILVDLHTHGKWVFVKIYGFINSEKGHIKLSTEYRYMWNILLPKSIFSKKEQIKTSQMVKGV